MGMGHRPVHPITDRVLATREPRTASTNTTGICTPAQGRWRSKRAQASPLDLSAPGTQYWSRAVHSVVGNHNTKSPARCASNAFVARGHCPRFTNHPSP